MESVMNLEFCFLVFLAGSYQARGQSVVLTPVATLQASLHPAGASGVPDLTKGRVDGGQHQIYNPVDDTATAPTLTHQTMEATSQPFTTSQPGTHAAAPHGSSPATTLEGMTEHPLSTFSSQDANTSTQPQPVTSWRVTTTAGRPLTSHIGQDPAGPHHLEVPSELNVGDEEHKRLHSPLNPLLAGLLCVFIVTTAVVFIILFMRFRQRTNNPEFHRLQDLPMDDLMEDTPLSRYTY
uniref:uncharacterized protein LOC131125857 n=1 Tax=Doryrhamphus excisus TaxID=161450 RepID=UPI0025ADEC6F|nr:uncharacterized protein LOC131125857 [Doryrhamphus excisus]